MKRLALIAGLALTGCAAAPDFDQIPLRNPTVPISAISRFDADRFAGDWVVHQSGGGAWPLAAFEVSGPVWLAQYEGASDPQAGQIDPIAPGRFRVTLPDAPARDVWVLWIDPDHNTAALGTPDGSFGFVVARRGAFRADQAQAARDVLAFNGYRPQDWARGAQ